MQTRYVMGLDLGKKVDRSAAAILRIFHDEEKKRRLQCGYLREWKRDTPYMQIVQDVAVLKQYDAYKDMLVVFDNTGLGEVFKEMLEEVGINYHGVTISGGLSENVGIDESSVPKVALVSGLIAKLETGVLTIHRDCKHAKLFRRQLAAFHSKKTPTGQTSFGGHREHDDLIMALSLAAWGEKYGEVQIFIF